ncbi:hypothetical protein [Streptomyces sp. NPDC059708]|uniref:hypothetical protein n=1 Tax=Streptomyces sp. NPDC059708 TaxID=3346916 RepID=UPI00369348DE
MRSVLNGMSKVRRHELRHAYGPTDEVPGRLSRAAWGDAKTAASALSDPGLWLGELAVFDATVSAVPFLWDSAVADGVTTRPEVIELLEAITAHTCDVVSFYDMAWERIRPPAELPLIRHPQWCSVVIAPSR